MGRFGIQVLESKWREPHDDEDSEEDTEEEEPPHPIPFSPSWGRTRFSLYPPKETYPELQQRILGLSSQSRNDALANLNMGPREQCYPPLNQFWDASTASATAMIEYSQEAGAEVSDTGDEDDLSGITHLLQATTLMDPPPKHVQVQDQVGQKLKVVANAAANELQKLEQWKEAYVRRREKQHKEAFDTLRTVLKADHDAAKAILVQERQEKQQQEERVKQEKEEAKREQEAHEAATRKELEEQERKLREKAAKKEQQSKAKALAERKIAEAEAAKTAYVTKAREQVENLKQLRAEVEPFDKNKAISKRRMNMKKICRGRVNTISADVGKVQSVAAEVIAAIKAEKLQDDEMQSQLQQGVPNVTPDMAKGQKYFLDLLASSAVVRVQAEGFNGTRGDGFPLAAFLAAVASEAPEFVSVFEAHIYAVCPMAIPVLPKPGKDASEDDLMESLGMAKNKNGEFESFERFLQRTEGIVSMVADVMSSHPENHSLFGGHKAAIKWLEHFLEILPQAPVQLPLNTAPVLEGFLTGSGHMLSNLCGDEFKKLLNVVTTDIVTRLDEGAIGAPRAFRLKELVKDGFEGFRKILPPRALEQLYNDGGSAPPPLPVAPAQPAFGSTVGVSAAPIPFGASGGDNSSSNPFGSSGVQTPAAFGGQSANPFGASSNQPPSAFGTSGVSNQSPFGGNQSSGPSAFGNTSGMNDSFGGQQAASPFSAQPSPFGNQSSAAPFGAANTGNSSSFGAPGVSGGAAPSPFGGGVASSPFGGNSQAQQSTSFSSSPFGATGGATQSTPFGNSNPQQQTPFGGQPQGSAFGGGNFSGGGGSNQGKPKAPCRFFAQGKCRYGDNCRFSHEPQ